MPGVRTIRGLLFVALLVVPVAASPRPQQISRTLQVSGYSGQAPVAQVNGRIFVDLEALAAVTNGSLAFEGDRIVLTLSASAAGAAPPSSPPPAGFSRAFMRAGIETIAAMREWGSALVVAIQSGYPIGGSMSVYRGRAMDQLRLAGAAASTDDDRNGLQLLTNEFNNVESWSNKLVSARNSMSAANLTMSDDALQSDPQFQNLVGCGRFLGSMFAGGSFQDDGTCH